MRRPRALPHAPASLDKVSTEAARRDEHDRVGAAGPRRLLDAYLERAKRSAGAAWMSLKAARMSDHNVGL